MTDMPPEVIIKFSSVFLHKCLNLLQRIGMASDSPLTKDHECSRENIGTLYRNGDRHGCVGVCKYVPGSAGDTGSPYNIHGVVYNFTAQLSKIIFCNSGNDGWFRSFIQGAANIASRCIEQVGIPTNSCHWLFNTLKFPNVQAKLFTYGRVGPDCPGCSFCPANSLCRQ